MMGSILLQEMKGYKGASVWFLPLAALPVGMVMSSVEGTRWERFGKMMDAGSGHGVIGGGSGRFRNAVGVGESRWRHPGVASQPRALMCGPFGTKRLNAPTF